MLQYFLMKKTLSILLFLPAVFFSQAPAGYYSGTESLTGYALKTKLYEIISTKTVNWHYGDLVNYYGITDLDKYYDHDASNSTYLLDIYSEIHSGQDTYEYTVDDMTGSSTAEGSGWNREHMMPQSTFNSTYPMYSDLHYVIPTDARINQLRSNYPYGVAGTTNYDTFSNGSKISRNGTPGSAYTGRVYEPIDEFKGDIARSLLYFSVRYEKKLPAFEFYNGTSPANDRNPLDGTQEKAFEDWYLAMLLQWHNLDPVSQREVDRNNLVYGLQKNRNPFVDNPQWVNLIWNQAPDAVPPQAPSNLTVAQNSAYFVNLSWNASPDSDVLGYKIFKNGELVATTKSPSVTVDHLDPSSSYFFTVKSYDNGYNESAESTALNVMTLASDIYARDLQVTKYLEGSANNKAIEITNRTGHPVNLEGYKLSLQYYNNPIYYFPAAFELEGTVQNNETFVVINPNANFTCFTNDQAKFVTAAPQLTYTGNNYVELRYKSTTVDVLGALDTNNSSVLENVSLYRNTSVLHPTATFNLAEWTSHPSDYCENLGTLSAADVITENLSDISLYPNPVVGDVLYLKGQSVANVKDVRIFDVSGRLMLSEQNSFKDKNYLNVQKLQPGVYLLQLDHRSLKFIKK